MLPVSMGIQLSILVYEGNAFSLKRRGGCWQVVVWVRNLFRNVVSFIESVYKSD